MWDDYHLLGGGGIANVVWTSQDSTGVPTPLSLVIADLVFLPGVLIHGTAGGGMGMATPTFALALVAELNRLRGGKGCCGDGL